MEEERPDPPDGCTASQAEEPSFLVIETGEEAEEEPRDFVRLELVARDGFCSDRYYGKMYVLESRHSKRKIGVMIETTWWYQNQRRRSTRSYSLSPGEMSDIGCNIPGPSDQKFTRRIKEAWFM